MLASVTMPRSPQTTTRSIPKRRFSRSSAEGNVLSSWMLPSKTSTATGRPSGEQVSRRLATADQ